MESMNNLIDQTRQQVRRVMNSMASIINRLSRGRVTPNMITILGLLGHFLVAWLIANQVFIWSGILLVIFGLLDAIDGSLARIQGSASKKGMLLDSITDRIKEVVIYAGIAYALVTSGEIFYTVWVVIACGLSTIVSYINAWGEVVSKKSNKASSHETNTTFRNGIMTYDVRMFTLVIGLLSGYLKQAVLVVAILSLVTIYQRFSLVVNKVDDV